MDKSPSKSEIIVTEKLAARVSMSDAVVLDDEIYRILKEQLIKLLNTVSPKLLKWEPEVNALLHLAIWKLSVMDMGATFGQQLLNLKYGYKPSKQQILILGLLKFGVQYLHQRTSELASLLNQPTRDQVLSFVSWLELAVQSCTLLNALMFLNKGVFPTLAERVAGLKLVSASTKPRTVGYNYMSRELLWHGFSELIVFILPLVNYKYLRGWLNRAMGIRTNPTDAKELVYTTATRCAVCQQPPVLPHQMGCAHAFCYYCLQSNLHADFKFACPSCGYISQEASTIQPVQPILLNDARL